MAGLLCCCSVFPFSIPRRDKASLGSRLPLHHARRAIKPPLCMAQATLSCRFAAIHLEGRWILPKAKDGGIVKRGICSRSSLTIPHRLSAEPPLHKGALDACKIRSKSRQECAQAADAADHHRHPQWYKAVDIIALLSFSHPRRDKAPRGLAFAECNFAAHSYPFFSLLRAAIGGAMLRTASSTRRYKSPCASGFLGPGKALNRRGCGGRQGA